MSNIEKRNLSDAEISFLRAYEAATDEGKQRIMMHGTLLANVLRPGETDSVGDELARIFIDAPSGQSLKAIKRKCWQIISQHRMAMSNADGIPAAR